MRGSVLALVVAVLGSGCTEDRPPAGAEAKPVCDVLPGRGVEGFVLEKTSRIDEGEHVAVRRDYRDPEGRLLVYLLGVHGEVGEGAARIYEVRLVDGTPARFTGGHGNWALVWEDKPPCPQVAVVGNGFPRGAFARLLVEAHLVGPDALTTIGAPAELPEWVAVLETADDPNDLDRTVEELMDTVPRDLVVAQVGCHRGLAAALGVPDHTYFAGVVAESNEDLDRLTRRLASSPGLLHQPLLVGEFGLLCPGS